MKSNFSEVVQFLESLQIMPKTMPGLQKITKALQQTDWYSKIRSEQVIVVAGTNGKGSTCAALEALLLAAQKKVGFYSSPHLISTNERIRLNGLQISETDFVKVFEDCEKLIKDCELSHFEALTLMAGHFYFSKKWNLNLDYIIFEVGLGGSYDATNAFPHQFSVITPIDFDHVNILGKTLNEIARNKFGIVRNNNTVIYQKIAEELSELKNEIQKQTHSTWAEVEQADLKVIQTNSEPEYWLQTKWGEAKLSLLGERAAQNSMTALLVFEKLGFAPSAYLRALSQIKWSARMQKMIWPQSSAPVYLSGDHNPHGVKSLIQILKDFSWSTIYIVIGIGQDKDADEMLAELTQLKNMKLFLTVTPFKGRGLDHYPQKYLDLAELKNENPVEILNSIAQQAKPDDLILVTGSLYLVGDILKKLIQS
jgi:dihydrofolate synthase/folylpolyglutamate synthase